MSAILESAPTATKSLLDCKTTLMRFPHLVQNPPRKIAPELGMLGGVAAAAGQVVDTYDWDTVFAIRFSDVNTELAKPGSTPATFTSTDTGVTASGNFGPWQLSGGDGVLLHMTVPITAGSMPYMGTTYDLTGAVATIEIQLKDLPQPPGANGTPHQVVPNATAAVAVTDLSNLPGNPGFIIKGVVTGLLDKWFNANLAQFTHTFSTVDLNEKADTAGFQWLKPTALGWAVSAQGAVADYVFGVLAMTSNRTAPGTMQISPNAIPTGQRAGFLIAQERFLEELVLPGVPTMFPGSKATDFEISGDGTMIRNVNTVNMEPVSLSTGTFTPTLPANQVQITMEASEIVVKLIKAEVDFSPGIKIMMDYTGYSAMQLALNSKGEQILNYVQASAPVTDHNVEVASWVVWTEVAASVAAAIITMGTGAVFKKVIENIVLRVVAIIITLLVTELIANIGAIITAIATGDKDKIPPVNLMVVNATSPVTWPGSSDFLLTSAALNQSFQLGGDPKFAA
jgi:Clostridium P-47 protein